MWPRTLTIPSDGVMIPARTCRSVLFPAPFGPITASDSPWTTLSETSRSAQNLRSPSPRRAIDASVWRKVFLRVRRRL